MPDIEPERLAAVLLPFGFPALLAVAAAGDLARRRIGNRLALALALLYLPAALAAGAGAAEIAWHVGAGAAVLAAGLALAMANLLGGGDAKLLAAAASWTGFSALPAFLIAVALAGGVMALALLLARALPGSRTADSAPPARDMPYGPAIAVGGLVVWPEMAVVSSLPNPWSTILPTWIV